jgi:fibronectin-binding autotransporter adhesin
MKSKYSLVRIRATRRFFLPSILATALAMAWSVKTSQAQSLHWDSNGATAGAGATPTGTWGTSTFWSTSSTGEAATAAWTSGATAIFSAGTDATSAYTVTLSGAQTIGGLTVEEGTPTISGAGSIALNNAATPFNITGTANISSVISGANFGISKTGTGTLNLTGVNTFTGGVSVVDGTVTSTLSTTQNSLGAGAVSIAAAKTLQINNTNVSATTPTIGNSFTGTGLLRLNFAANTTARNTTMNNVTGFAGTIQLSNAGTNSDKWSITASLNAPSASVTLDSGSQMYVAGTGVTATFAGTTIQGTGNNENRGAVRLAGTLAGPVILANSATIGTEGGTISGGISSGAAGAQTITFGTTNSTGNTTASGVIGGGTGTVALTKVAAGTLTLSNTNTYTGDTTISAGTINLTGRLGSGNYAGAIVMTGALTYDNANQQIFTGVISGAGALTKNNTGTLILQNQANTRTGTSTVNAGELQAFYNGTTAGTYTNLGTGNVVVNAGATLRFRTGSTTNAMTWANNISLNNATLIHEDAVQTLSGVISLGGSNVISGRFSTKNLVLSGVISGVGSIVKTSTAGQETTLTLSGANTFSGPLTVADGVVQTNTAASLGNASWIIVQNAENPGASNTNGLNLSGGVIHGSGKTLILRNSSTSNVGNARTQINNASGNNTWAGDIVLEGGTNQTITSAAGTFTVSGAVTQASSPSTSLFIRGASNGLFTGSMNIGSCQLYKTDAGTWTFSSSGNTHGTIVIGNSSLVANATNAFNPVSSLVLGEGNSNVTRFVINGGFSQQLSSIANAGSTTGGHFVEGAGSLNVGMAGIPLNISDVAAANDLTLTANVIGSGTLTKNGSGRLVMNNTVEGLVALAGGTMFSTSTLGGLSTAASTTLHPGSDTAVGTITTSTLALNDGTLAVNVGALGTDSIVVTATNGLTQSGTTAISVTPNGSFDANSTFYPLISYTGASPGVAGFTLSALPGRVAGTITDNGSAIGITATNERVVWTGGSGDAYAWDNSQLPDWKKLSDNTETSFLSQDDVIFNDDGIAKNLIGLSGTINPTRVQFSHTSGEYVLATGTLAGFGNMPLSVTSGGKVIMRNANTYTGPTTVTGNSILEVDHTTGSMTATSGVQVDAGSSLQLTRDNALDFTFNRNISGAGTVVIDPNKAGTPSARGVTINGTNSGFSGIWDIAPSGTRLTNGTVRMIISNANHLGTGSVITRNGGQLWVNGAVNVANPLTLTGAGHEEAGGGIPATAVTAADASTLTAPALEYGGIGAVRMENNGVLSGPITLSGTTKIMPYSATATISGNMSNVAATDDFVFGGGGAGSNLWLTGDNSALERIWVNGGGSTGTNQLLVGNNTTTGTLGTGDVILYQDAAAATMRFQRSDGYTLAAGQKIIAAHNGTATNLSKARVVINTPGAGVTLNGGTIDLSDGTSGGELYVGGFLGANGVNGSVLNIDAGSTVDVEKLFVGDQSGISGTVNQTGGTVSVINQVRFGHYPNNTSTWNLSGGSLTISTIPTSEPSGTVEQNGALYLGNDGAGVLNHSGGLISTPAVVVDNRGVTTGTQQYNLSGGTLELRTSYGLVGRNTTSFVNLSGGTIRNTGTGVDVAINSHNLSVADTTTLDTNGATNKFTLMSSITGSGTLAVTGDGLIELEPDSTAARTSVSTGAGNQVISAVITGTSALTKLGAGTSTLTGANTYSGATTVSAGRLDVTGSLTNSDLTVSTGASLGGEGSAKTIAFGAGTTNLVINPNTSAALVSNGLLTVGGTVSVDLSTAPLAPGVTKVLSHGGTTATASNFTLVNAGNYRGTTFVVEGGSDGVTAGDVTIDLSTKSLVWDGSTATWEIGGAENDWNDTANDNFFNGDAVTFNDTFVTANQAVTMVGALLPGAVTVNNTTYNYALSGSGFGGATGLVKSGTGLLTLAGDNTFTGGLTINGGTVNVAGTSALGANNGQITVASGAQLNYKGIAINAARSYSLTIAGDGPDNLGAVINDTANIGANSRILNLTLTGNASIGAYGGTAEGNRIDIANGGTINGGGFVLTKKGPNMVNMRGAATNISYVVEEGTMRAETSNLSMGSTGVTVNSGAILESWGALNFNVPVNLQSGATLASASGVGTWEGPLSIGGIAGGTAILGGAGTLQVTNTLTETAPTLLSKTGNSTTVITGMSNHSGGTRVDTGILRVSSDAALGVAPVTPSPANLTLQNGGRLQIGNTTTGLDFTLDPNRGVTLPSGNGGFHVWIGFTLNYAGAISGAGNLIKTDGGTLVYSGNAGHTGSTQNQLGTLNLNGANISSTSGLILTGGSVTNLNADSILSTTGLVNVQTATLNINAGTMTSGRFVTSNAASTISSINLTGGTVNITGTDSSNTNTASVLLGHFGTGARTNVTISGGTFNATGAAMTVGFDALNTAVTQTGGTVNVQGLNLIARSNGGGYLITGGRLNLGSYGISLNTVKTITAGGGTIGAYANWNTSQPINLSGINGAVTINNTDSLDEITPREIALNGVLSGAGGLIKTGAGRLTLAATNTFTGNTIINEGVLDLTGGGGANGTIRGTLTVNTSGTVRLSANDVTGFDATTRLGVINLVGGAMDVNTASPANQTLGNAVINMTGASITGIATSNLDFFQGSSALNSLASSTTSTVSGVQLKIRQTGGLTINTAVGTTLSGVDLNVSSVIAADAGFSAQPLIKAGAGTLQLSGVSTYTSNTAVNAGRLLLSGSVAGTASVAASATLAGNGTVNGAATVAAAGTVSPGNSSVATLNFGNTLDLNIGSNYAVGVTGNGVNDRVNVTGALVANGNINVTLESYTPVANDTFDLADAASITGTPTFNLPALSPGLSWDTSTFATNGQIKVISADPFLTWASGFGLSGGDAAKSADPDGDGVNNLLEFATNSSPTNGGSGARVYGKIHLIAGTPVLTYTVATRADATFAPNGSKQESTKDLVKYTIEGSDNLSTWNTVVVTEVLGGDATAVRAAIVPALPTLETGWEWHTFRTDGDTSSDASDYIRLNVTEVP